jgi:DNA repair protein RadC
MKEYKEKISAFKIVKDIQAPEFRKVKINTSKDAFDYMMNFYSDDIEVYESMFAIYVNKAHNTVAWVKISQGGTSGTVVDVKIVCKYAIDLLASGVIVAHNHPSGVLKPSEHDKKLTENLKDGLKLFNIDLLDHLILSNSSYYSFRDEGML